MDNPRARRSPLDRAVSEIPEMVERVARAIAKIYGDEVEVAEYDAAKAAIAAMMEPTETMVQCGGALSFNPDGRNMDNEARIVFQGMLRQALET